MKTVQIPSIFINVSRAYEIAALGSHSITLIHSPEYVNGSSDYELIKQAFSPFQFSSSLDADIVVEICEPDYDQVSNKRRGENLELIHERIEAAKNYPMPTIDLDQSCEQLLKTGTSRLNFSIQTIETIKTVAQTIARLDNMPNVRAQHIAEAMQYQAFDREKIVLPESNTAVFGRISIYKGDIEKSDIEAAIEYLQSKLINQ